MTGHYPLRALRQHATRNDPLGLTRTERKVALLLCTHTVPGAAAELGLKAPTVVRHRRTIYWKLRIKTRDELRARLTVQELSEPFEAELDRAAWLTDPRAELEELEQ
jgi:DNA-binding CsgD family transcriptional regulator